MSKCDDGCGSEATHIFHLLGAPTADFDADLCATCAKEYDARDITQAPTTEGR